MRHDTAGSRDIALVEAWAEAQLVPPWKRPARLLAALGALPDPAHHALPLGLVGAAALRAAQDVWSGPLEAHAPCAACGESIAIELPADAILALTPAADATRQVAAADHRLTLRAPCAEDLAAVADAPDAAAAARLLLARCSLEADPPLPAAPPAALLDAADAAIEELDPLAALTIAVTCPACGAPQAPQADLAAWGHALLEARVRRLFDEVHRLASAYGWTEREILALGPARRRAYLELVP